MKKITSYTLIGGAIFVFLILILMLSPILNIKNIEINGTKRIDKNDLIKTLSLDKPTNIFMFNKFTAKKRLINNYYIEDISIDRKLPNTMIINIIERDIIGYIPYANGYLYIDTEGLVVDTKPIYKETLPIIYGLSFDSFKLGKPLSIDKSLDEINKKRFYTVVEIASTLHEKELYKKNISIDISNIDDIHLYIGNVDVVFGDKDAVNIKINILNEILKNFSAKERGILYINDISKPPTFRYIT